MELEWTPGTLIRTRRAALKMLRYEVADDAEIPVELLTEMENDAGGVFERLQQIERLQTALGFEDNEIINAIVSDYYPILDTLWHLEQPDKSVEVFDDDEEELVELK